MRRTLAVSLFVLATMTWVLAQNPSGAAQNSQQPPSATQTPDASQSQPGTAGQSATQDAPQPAAPSASGPVTEGCLGGSSPNFTLTDKTGTTYKLNLPPNANASVLTPHLGESIRVMGDVKDAGKAGQASIDVTKAGKGSSTCPAGSASQPQQPPKQ